MEMTIEREVEMVNLGHQPSPTQPNYCPRCSLYLVCGCGDCAVCLGLPCSGAEDTPPRKLTQAEREVRSLILDKIRENRHDPPEGEWEHIIHTGSEGRPKPGDVFVIRTPCCGRPGAYMLTETGCVVLTGTQNYPHAGDKGQTCPKKVVKPKPALTLRSTSSSITTKAGTATPSSNEEAVFKGDDPEDVLRDLMEEYGHDPCYEGLDGNELPYATCYTCGQYIGPGEDNGIVVQMVELGDGSWRAAGPMQRCEQDYCIKISYSARVYYEGTGYVTASSPEEAKAKAKEEFENGDWDCEWVDEDDHSEPTVELD